MSVGISNQSPLALHHLDRSIQQEVLSFCGATVPFLYGRVNRTAAEFSMKNGASSLYFRLKTAKNLDWERIEKDTAAFAHVTDQQIRNLDVKATQNFTNFLHQLREIVALAEGDEKNARLFKLFLSFCPKVTKLDLTTSGTGNKLAVVSSILEAPGIHSRIKVLKLSENDNDVKPISLFSSHISRFDSLESLECRLSTEDLDALTSIPSFQRNLKSLAIVCPTLTSFAPFGKLTCLQSLDLKGSATPDSDPLEVPSMPQLRALELDNASDVTVQAICNACPRLERLKIESAKAITDLGVEPIAQLKFLRELHLLLFSRITEKAFKYLASSPYLRKNLRSLSVVFCSAAARSGLKHVAEFTNLVELDLTNSAFDEKGFSSLAALQKLQKLDCSFIDATDDMFANIGKIRSLQCLDFFCGSCEKVTDLGMASLRNLQDLRFFTFGRSAQITDKGYRYLGDLTRLEKIWRWPGPPMSPTSFLQNFGNPTRPK